MMYLIVNSECYVLLFRNFIVTSLSMVIKSPEKRTLRIFLVNDGGVGKTSLILYLVSKQDQRYS